MILDMYNLKQIPSEAQIKKYIRRILFGKNVFCPLCRSRKVIAEEHRYWCRSCRTRFTLISHTWLKGMKLSYQKFWMILWCWTTQVPVRQTVALTRLSEETIGHWFDQFRTHLPENRRILARVVQLDEAYFKRNILLMGKQRGTRNLAYEMLAAPSAQRHHAAFFLEQYVRPRSRLYTDGALIYRGINRWWPVRHRYDIHKKFEFTHTSEIEGVFVNLRTFIRRMYHHATPEKLPEYVREFVFRFSSPELFSNPHTYLQKSLTLATFD